MHPLIPRNESPEPSSRAKPRDRADRETLSARRKHHLLGGLALLCLISGGAILAAHHWENVAGASLLRTGLLLGVLWLALPSRWWPAAWAHLSVWNLLGLVLLCLVAGRFKHIFLGGIAAMALGSIFLRPRRRR